MMRMSNMPAYAPVILTKKNVLMALFSITLTVLMFSIIVNFLPEIFLSYVIAFADAPSLALHQFL